MIERNTLIDDILKQHRSELNVDYDKYRHHVYRVFNFTLLLHEATEKETDALAVAAAYHDIGIWTAGTFDYLEPSLALAKEYIKAKQPKVSAKAVEQIIMNHHKITSYKDISHRDILELYQTFPESNFHLFILKEVAVNTFKNPFNPLPIYKW